VALAVASNWFYARMMWGRRIWRLPVQSPAMGAIVNGVAFRSIRPEGSANALTAHRGQPLHLSRQSLAVDRWQGHRERVAAARPWTSAVPDQGTDGDQVETAFSSPSLRGGVSDRSNPSVSRSCQGWISSAEPVIRGAHSRATRWLANDGSETTRPVSAAPSTFKPRRRPVGGHQPHPGLIVPSPPSWCRLPTRPSVPPVSKARFG